MLSKKIPLLLLSTISLISGCTTSKVSTPSHVVDFQSEVDNLKSHAYTFGVGRVTLATGVSVDGLGGIIYNIEYLKPNAGYAYFTLFQSYKVLDYTFGYDEPAIIVFFEEYVGQSDMTYKALLLPYGEVLNG